VDAGLALTPEIAIVLALIGFVVFALALDLLRADLVALLVLVVIGVAGIVPVEQLFSGFGGDAVIAIIAMMILGAGLDRTGVIGRVAGFILRASKGMERRLLMVLCAITGALSAFVQNPAVAALFLPVASRLSARSGVTLSRLLMPMAACIMLGGTMTMVGNSPQILLNDLLVQVNRNLPPGAASLEPLRMFSLTPIGIVLLLAGLAYFHFGWRRLLPEQAEPQRVVPRSTDRYFADTYGIAGEVVELVVTGESDLVGMSIAELERQQGTPLVLGIRQGEEARLAPPGDMNLWTGTILAVLGPREAIAEWSKARDLRALGDLRHFGGMLNPTRAGIAEAVVPPASRFVGQKVGDLRLRKRHGISVLALNRGDKIFREDLRDRMIRAGDTLVFHGFWRDLAHAAEDRDFVVVTDYPQDEERPHKLGNALTFFAIAIGLALFSDLRISVALMVGAVAMLLTGVLNMDEAYRAVNWKTVFLLAGLIPLGWAVDSTGSAAWLAQELFGTVGSITPWLLLVAVALLTTFFTQVMSNVGATVVMVPLAINLALAANANPVEFAMIVVLSASNSFLSLSNPVMAIIAGPGGYRGADFWRVGGPLTLGYIAISVVGVVLLF
jgi:di/tricarboxylate transporter